MSDIFNKISKYDFAHRGLYTNPSLPENSIPAFREAIINGFAFEFDVHLTRDEKLVCIHDSDLLRACNVKGNIEDLTLEEIKKLRLFNSIYTIPEFSEVLNLNSGRVPMLIELKVVNSNHKKLADLVLKELKGYKGDYVIESFYPLCVRYIRKNYPNIVVGQLAGDIREEIGFFSNLLLKNLFVNLISLPDFVSYKYDGGKNIFFKKFTGPKFSWTIKNIEEYNYCMKNDLIPIFEGFNPKEIK